MMSKSFRECLRQYLPTYVASWTPCSYVPIRIVFSQYALTDPSSLYALAGGNLQLLALKLGELRGDL